MKATGIVRRIDELGRVVIPKEIRRTLRIREGDPLEIFTDREGEVILKKYSPIGELGDFAKEYAESLHNSLEHIAAICDKDVIIAVSGGAKRELMDKSIHENVERLIKNRERAQLSLAKDSQPILITTSDDESTAYTAATIVPILSQGDAIGAVMLLSRDAGSVMGTTEMKVCETAANFMGKQMES
ncbi:MAG: Stage V sporulation protein T [Firmicutes bacterium ADurb.Bin182]|nr:MAG: Stage V sporulation protein T [Firmicutes bacterium ADurb.Bin182]